MKYQRLAWFSLLTIFALTPKTARAQWSSPTLVACESPYGGPAQLVHATGDTFWLLRGAWDTSLAVAHMRAYWSAADSWRGPVVLWSDSAGNFWTSGQAASDPQGRIWVAWSTVIPDNWPPWFWNGTVWYVFRDSSGWHSPDSADWGMNVAPFGMNFAGDRNGNWYLGWGYHAGYGTQSISGTCYQRWLGGRWDTTTIEMGGGFQVNCGAPLLSPDPDTALWAVISRHHGDTNELQIYRSFANATSLRFRLPADAASYGIATDSAGRVLVTYIRDAELRWMGIEHEQIVDSGLVYWPVAGSILTAVDPQGAIWTAWSDGTTIWASYNRGLGWTGPEVVADFSSASVDCIAFDSSGLPHIAFEQPVGDTTRIYVAQIYVTQRLSHVGAAERRPAPGRGVAVRLLSPNPFAGTARVEFQVGVAARIELRVCDITGRTIAVLEEGVLSPGTYRCDWHAALGVPNGVYFLSFAAGSCREVRKLVLTR